MENKVSFPHAENQRRKPDPTIIKKQAERAEADLRAYDPFWDVLTDRSNLFDEISRPNKWTMLVEVSSSHDRIRLLNEAQGIDDTVRERLLQYFKHDAADENNINFLSDTYKTNTSMWADMGLEMHALIGLAGQPKALIITYTRKDNGKREMMHCLPCGRAIAPTDFQTIVNQACKTLKIDPDKHAIGHAVRVNEVMLGHIKTDYAGRDAAENEQPRSAWYQAQLARYEKSGVKEWVSPSTAQEVKDILNSSLILSQHSDSFDVHEDGTVTRKYSSFWGQVYSTESPLTFRVLKHSGDVQAIMLCEGNKVIRCFGLGDEHREFNGDEARTQYECPSGKALPEIASFITENGLELAVQCSKYGFDMTPYATGLFRDERSILHNLFDMKDGETIHGNMWISDFPAPINFGNNTNITGHANFHGCKQGISLGNRFKVMKDADFGAASIIYGSGTNIVGDLRAHDASPITDGDCLIGGNLYISRMSYVTSKRATLLPSHAVIVGGIMVDKSDFDGQIKFQACSSVYEANALMLRQMRSSNNLVYDNNGEAHYLLDLEKGGVFEGDMTIEQNGGPAVIPHQYTIHGDLYAKGCSKPIMFGNDTNVTGITDLSGATSITWGNGGRFNILNVSCAGPIKDPNLTANTIVVDSADSELPESLRAKYVIVQGCGYDGKVHNCSKIFTSVRAANAEMLARQNAETAGDNLIRPSTVVSTHTKQNRLALQ